MKQAWNKKAEKFKEFKIHQGLLQVFGVKNLTEIAFDLKILNEFFSERFSYSKILANIIQIMSDHTWVTQKSFATIQRHSLFKLVQFTYF